MRRRCPLPKTFATSRWQKLAKYDVWSRKARTKAAKLLVETRQSYREISVATGVSARTLIYWAKKIKAGNLDNVINPKMGRLGGRRPRIGAELQKMVIKRLGEQPSLKTRELRRWLEAEQGVRLSPQAMAYWIKKLKPLVPKPRRRWQPKW